jgi:thiamine transport system permease protein
MDQSRPSLTHSHATVSVGPPTNRYGLIPLTFLAVFFVWPLVTMLRRGLDWSAFGTVFGDSGVRSVLWFTLWQALISTLATVVCGVWPAYVVSRYRFVGRGAVSALLTVPFVLPTVVVGLAFLALLPDSYRRTVPAIIIAHVWMNVAVVVRTVGGFVGQMDPRLEDAAATLGASRWRTLRYVVGPLARPSILGAAAIVFLFCFTSFGIVRILGGPAHPTLEVEIWRRTTQSLDLPTAAALSVIQVTMIVLALSLWTWRQRHSSAGPLRLRTNATFRTPATAFESAAVAITALCSAAFVLIPVGTLVSQSFRSARRGQPFAAWRALLHSDLGASIWASGRIAAVAMVIASLVGGLASIAIAGSPRHGRLLDAGLMLPLGTSAVTIGFGLLITFNRPPVDLRASWVMLPLGHALVAIPFVVRAVLPTLRSIDPQQRYAAASLGANPWQVWRNVDLPMLRRSLVIGAGFAAAISIGEFGASSFLARRGIETVPLAISRLLGRPSKFNLAEASALSTVLLVAVVMIMLTLDHLPDTGRRARRSPGGGGR